MREFSFSKIRTNTSVKSGKSEAVFSVQIERRNRNVSEAMADYSIIARNRHLQSGIIESTYYQLSWMCFCSALVSASGEGTVEAKYWI